MLRKIRGQSTAEYAVVLSLVIAAVIGMQIYVKRSLSARVKAGADAFATAGAGQQFSLTDSDGKIMTADYKELKQYEPYYNESGYDTYSENVEQEHTGGGSIVKEKVSDVNIRLGGGKTIQRGATEATEREQIWESSFGPQQ